MHSLQAKGIGAQLPFIGLVVGILLFQLLAPGQDQSATPSPQGKAAGGPAVTKKKGSGGSKTTSSSKSNASTTSDSDTLLTSPDAREVAVFKCAAFQTPIPPGTNAATYSSGCPLEQELGVEGPRTPAPLPKSAGSSPSTRLADVFAKYSSQPLKTGTNGDTQLAAGLKQVLKYAYNGESIFPDGNSYAIIHLVDRQGVANGVKAVQAQAEQAMQNAQKGTANTTLAKKATASGKATVSKKGTNVDRPDLAPTGDKSKGQPAGRWILAHRDKITGMTLSEDKRIFGAKSMSVIFIHVNANINSADDPIDTFGDVSYRAIAKSKMAQNVSDLLGLVQVAIGVLSASPVETKVAYMGFGLMTQVPVPSDVTAFGVESQTADTPDSPQKWVLVGQSAVYDNEGKYWWDASIAVPVNKLSLVDYSQANNTFTPKTINKQSVYGVIDLFFPKVDLKHVQYIPHPIFGIGFTGRPGENFMYGLSAGIPKLQFFIGEAYADHTTQTGQQHYHHALTFGINLPVVSAIKQLANKKSSGSKKGT